MVNKKDEAKFEDNLGELELIVKKLENGDVALEDAISEFQRGMQLSEKLKKTLTDAEKTLVTVVGENGEEKVMKEGE
ncbi:exodeoxyribonuclease VII small subunit [Lactococcus nasutitermitis]|uniref:Exodeoxyribonuclease 7 small subunit n=1 Tax=Lactococcus nasutitermitis TaxID=1652957 RepID=A0ABV9JER9_9LACT|nr:exodeoxyribonuclease VII small subunit [Lactococcus nasutitermitis]